MKAKYNKPMDRDYFKKKKDPKWDAKKKLTECCEQDVDHEVLNVFKKDDWEQIEEHIRQQLHDYSNTETITPISCETCGRLLEYSSTLNENTWKPGYLRK
tara:strand:+ start:373 stop:672 length:300 start_codon:yes stop_codon:yes gene_type:complete